MARTTRNRMTAGRWSVYFLIVFFSSMALPLSAAPQDCAKNVKATVLSRNLYIGADIFRVVEAATDPSAGPLDVPRAVAEVFQTIQYTNFSERAEAIADEIQRIRPHLIGLQEVSTIFRQTPGDFLIGNPSPAQTLVFDYLDILLEALRARKLNYEVAAAVFNADVELPMLIGIDAGGMPVLDDVRLVDRDVILVSKDVFADNAIAANYATNIAMPISGTTIAFTRGYAAVDAEIHGRRMRFVNTHLEVSGGSGNVFSAVQAAQMFELLTVLSTERLPVILVGDFNSSPHDTVIESELYDLIVPPYMQAAAAGYIDIATVSKKAAGPTCCFNETVDDPDAQLYERIDHIFLGPQAEGIPKATVLTVGDEVRDMTADGLWPSDHAGVVGKIKSPGNNGQCPDDFD